jgi:argininosuccinate lyase
MPSMAHEMPVYFRLWLTASDEMIERSLPRFAAALEEARAHPNAQAVANLTS